MKHRLLAALLLAALLLTILPSANAAEFRYLYRLEDGNAVITGYEGALPDEPVIPDTLDGHPVTEIGVNAFKQASISKISLPAGLKRIEDNAFNCSSLREIDLPDGIEYIGEHVFGNTKLTRLFIPASVKYLGNQLNMPLEIVVLYGKDTLRDDGWADYFPSGTKIYGYRSCPLIQKQSSYSRVYYLDEYLFNPVDPEILTEGDFQYVLTDGEASVCKCTGSGDITVPDTLGGYPVVALAPESCNSAGITSLTLPDTIRIIGSHAADGGKVSSVNLPASLEYIGDYVFSGTDFGNLTLPQNLHVINKGAFSGCRIGSLVCPPALRTIGDSAFEDCGITSITLSEGLTTLGNKALYGCRLSELTVPASLTTCSYCINAESVGCVIGYPDTEMAVYCAENSIPFANILTGEEYPLAYRTMRSGISYRVLPAANCVYVYGGTSELLPDDLVIPDQVDGYPVTKLFCGFENCRFQSVTLPETLRLIGGEAFSHCTFLEAVYLPDQPIEISWNAFSGCQKLYSLYLPPSVTIRRDNGAFGDIGGGITVFIGYPDTDAERYAQEKNKWFCALQEGKEYVIDSHGVYGIENGEATLVHSLITPTSASGIPTLPDYVEDYPLVRIAAGAYPLCSPEILKLGNNIRVVENGAFPWDDGPMKLFIPPNVEYVCPPNEYFSEIYGVTGTYAERYARLYGLQFYDMSTTPFHDVPRNAWYHDYVREVYWYKLMGGTSRTTFEPEMSTSRAMVVKVLANLTGVYEFKWRYGFTDVPEGTWYTDAVNWGRYYGIVNGTSATEFSPDAPVTREQLAAFLYRYAQLCKLPCLTNGSLSAYRDAGSVSAYAVDAMKWAVTSGIINGTSADTLSPQEHATRAQFAAMLCRFLDYIQNN